MKYLYLLSFGSAALIATAVVSAAPELPKTQQIPMNKTKVAQPQDQVVIYAAPEKNRILRRVPANTRLVPIFQKGDWVKVGNPRNGQVGWINRQQYRQAMKVFYRPDVQTVYIQYDHNKNGKPTINVVAYQNGKKLTQQEAQQIYNQMQRRDAMQQRSMQRFVRRMNWWANSALLGANNHWGNAPWWGGPVIVIREPSQKNNARK